MFLLPRDLQELFEILLLNYKELLRKGILNSPTSTSSAVPPLTPPPHRPIPYSRLRSQYNCADPEICDQILINYHAHLL